MHKTEVVFFRVLSDIKAHLDNLILVGGWVPYIYAKYLWRDIKIMPLATSDIDFGISASAAKIPPQTIYETLSPRYGRHHISMDRAFPIVFHLENIEIHFISAQDMPRDITEKLLGKQIDISKIEYFNILINNQTLVNIINHKNNSYTIYIPKPSAYVYHKGLTFIDRFYEDGKAKDLHYIYYILRFSPNLDLVLSGLKQFKKDKHFVKFIANINKYFERISSDGCLKVERENGPDKYIDDIRKDVFNRFRSLIKYLE